MIRSGALGICFFAALAYLTGCEVKDEAQTCHIVFDYAYNDKGHIEEMTLDENGDDSVDARVEYSNTYDEDGGITEVVTKCIRSDDKVKYKTVHELNELGRTVHSLYEGEEIKYWIHENGVSKSVEQRTFSFTVEYDDRDREISNTVDLDADGTPDEQALNTYDENDRKYMIDEGADGTIEFTRYYTFFSSEEGLNTSTIWEEVGLITTFTEFTYEYDEEGRKIGSTIDVRQDGVLEEECTITYDDEGKEEFCETMVNGAVTRERTAVRDSEGNLVMSLTENVDDGAASRSTHTYDDSRHRLTTLSEVRDNSEADWEETLRITYSYDEDGRKVSETRERYHWGPSTETCADAYLPGYQLTLSR